METLSTELLLVLSLADGPASGSEIAEHARAVTGDRGLLGAGTIYPALRRLRAEGLVCTWSEDVRSRVGRPRRFNELTAAGVEALARQRTLLLSLAGTAAPTRLSRGTLARMRADLRRAFAVSAFASRLQAALRESPGSRLHGQAGR